MGWDRPAKEVAAEELKIRSEKASVVRGVNNQGESERLQEELRHVRELLWRLVKAARGVLVELDALPKDAAHSKLLERGVELRIVTDNSGEPTPGREGGERKPKP